MKNKVFKDAAVSSTGPDDAFPGSFQVVLSSPTKDRDGDNLLPDEWKQPIPDWINFDVDHGMSTVATVGSGAPRIDQESGNLLVDGTYSSLPRAQELRTLVNEGHIRTVSVAFMSEPAEVKDGKTRRVRELLNGSFVAIPSNREALIMSSKTLQTGKVTLKLGARNSADDAKIIQSMHDMTNMLGATCSPEMVAAKPAKGVKSIVGSLEAEKDRVQDALEDAYPMASSPWIRGTLPDGNGGGVVVFDLSDPMSCERTTYRQAYADDGSMVTLIPGVTEVDIMEIVTPDADESADTGSEVMIASVNTPGLPSTDIPTARLTDPPAPAKAAPAQSVTPTVDESEQKHLWLAHLRYSAASMPPEMD